MYKQNTMTILPKINLYLLYAILISIVFSKFNLNSFFIILFFATWLLEGHYREKWEKLKADKIFLTYSLYFILQVFGLIYTSDLLLGWKHVEHKAGFFVLPLLLGSNRFLNDRLRTRVMLFFCAVLLATSAYCLAVAAYRYHLTSDSGVFFYHSLVKPIPQHAIYFSIYVFIAVLFLFFENGKNPWLIKNKTACSILIVYFVIILILLSSKLVLSLVFILLVLLAVRAIVKKRSIVLTVSLFCALVLGSGVVFYSDTPIRQRFSAIVHGDLGLIKKEQFTPITDWNGLQLRILIWRFTLEILQTQRAWILGVSPGDAQKRLNEKYIAANMYIGDKNRGDTGFLGYNCHNQFFQIMLQSGTAGLLMLITWMSVFFRHAVKRKDPVLLGILLITFFFFTIESVFERQFGMILCTFFPLLYYYGRNEATYER
ncbi:MAG: O-antigen ligase family protein [Chitinophagaceae bacterium]